MAEICGKSKRLITTELVSKHIIREVITGQYIVVVVVTNVGFAALLHWVACVSYDMLHVPTGDSSSVHHTHLTFDLWQTHLGVIHPVVVEVEWIVFTLHFWL